MPVGAYDCEGPPVPIPNTVVKLTCAYDTWTAASWENWSMPTLDPHSKSCEGLNLSLYCLLSDQEKIKKNLKKTLDKRGKI